MGTRGFTPIGAVAVVLTVLYAWQRGLAHAHEINQEMTIPILTKLLLISVSFNAALGQLMLKRGVGTLVSPTSLSAFPRFVLDALRSPWIVAAIAIQGFGYLLWMIVVSRVKLGVATASAGAAFYILVALCAWFFFGETLTSLQWLGIGLITAGVVFVSLSPV